MQGNTLRKIKGHTDWKIEFNVVHESPLLPFKFLQGAAELNALAHFLFWKYIKFSECFWQQGIYVCIILIFFCIIRSYVRGLKELGMGRKESVQRRKRKIISCL